MHPSADGTTDVRYAAAFGGNAHISQRLPNGIYEDRTPTHSYEVTHKAAIAVFGLT